MNAYVAWLSGWFTCCVVVPDYRDYWLAGCVVGARTSACSGISERYGLLHYLVNKVLV